MSLSGWARLNDALNRAADRGATIPVWWRDDDAVAHTTSLDRLLELTDRLHVPVGIAAVPAQVEQSLLVRLGRAPFARVLVHGLTHANHARSGDKKAEFGPHRPIADLAEDAAEGLRLARNHFGDLLVPVFVPPWNRISVELIERLSELGYCGLSAFGERPSRAPIPGLIQVNTHIDPIAWRRGRALADIDPLLAKLAQAVDARAASSVDDREPIGLLTHHLAHDEAVWGFCEELLTRLAGSSIIHFTDVDEMFVGAQTFAT